MQMIDEQMAARKTAMMKQKGHADEKNKDAEGAEGDVSPSKMTSPEKNKYK